MRWEKFLVALVIVFFAIVFQMRLSGSGGVVIDVALAALVAVGAVLTVGETALLIMFAAWALNWEPALSWELGVFMTVAISARLLRPLLPWQPWFSNLLAVGAAALGFNFLAAWPLPATNPVAFLTAWVGTLFVGAFIFQFLRVIFGREIGSAKL
ncbi:MAG: hypothetical protein AAB867_00275 [Patescibacteria group bacterium]